MGHNRTTLIRPRCLIASIALAPLIVCAVTLLLATVLFPTNWTTKSTLPPSSMPPTYLAPIAPDLKEVHIAIPASPSSGGPLFGGVNLGVDFISYAYGDSAFNPAFQPWDPAVTPDPPFVELTRFRFGWPRRIVSLDDISTGTSIADPAVMAYHRRAYALAKEHRGLNRPRWMPRFIPVYRIPVVVNWPNFAVNTTAMTPVAFVLLCIPPALRAIRRGRRARRGRCPACGYDVQTLTTCPECGPADARS